MTYKIKKDFKLYKSKFINFVVKLIKYIHERGKKTNKKKKLISKNQNKYKEKFNFYSSSTFKMVRDFCIIVCVCVYI